MQQMMKQSTQKKIAMLVLCCMLFTLLPSMAFAEGTIIDSGTCGTSGYDLTWTLDRDGTLTITGSGLMMNYPEWGENKSDIKEVIIQDGVTSIGKAAFADCNRLTSIEIPESVISIGEAAFWGCSGLKSITIPKSVISIDDFAFNGCITLQKVFYEGTKKDWDDISKGQSIEAIQVEICYLIWQSANGQFWKACTECGYKTAPITVTTSSGLVYTGKPQALITSGNALFVYSLEEEGDYKPEIPTGTDAGDYTVWFNIKDQSTTPQSVTVTIKDNNNNGYYGGGYVPEEELNKKDDTVWNNPFSDVSESDWYYNVVKYAHQNKLFAGVSATEFGPNMPMSRGMLVTVLYRLAGNPTVTGTMPFADVNANAYYYNAILWAVQNNIVSGVSATEFAPDVNITREQIASILQRYAQYKGYDTTQGGMQIREYSDYDKISGYAMNAMTWAVNSGLLKGKGNNTIAPQDATTRAEIAAILQRFIEGNK